MARDRNLAQNLNPSRRVLDILRQRIREGVYPVNARLPAERMLAEELGIGRAYVRKALSALEQEGIVERRQGRGTQVVDASPSLKTGRIALFGGRVEDWRLPEGAAIYAGVTERLTALGYAHDVFPVYFRKADRFTRQWGDNLISGDEVLEKALEYDGVILQEAANPPIRDIALALEARRKPCIVANLEIDLDVSATRIDHMELRRRSVEILAGFGHRRIAYVGMEPKRYFYGAALEGYREGMRAAGLQVDESLVVLTANSYSLHAYLAFKRALELPNPPTAVVCARDLYARGVCHAMEEFDLEPGYDLSLIAFDNCSWPVDDPFLTTFDAPCYGLGATAADMLSERLEDGWRPPEQRVLDAPLILRRSVGPVPKQGIRRRPRG